ncbi:MAG: ParA family protein [Actinomycetota bacterium]|nr:ParA family protein [Actinomycetota bacterium]
MGRYHASLCKNRAMGSRSQDPAPAAAERAPTATLVLSVLSLKGGVGKTSVVLGLAGAALERGISTLVVDVDPQANATAALDPEAAPYSLSDVLHDGRPGVAGDAVVASCWGEDVHLVPSERALEHRAAESYPGSEQRLRTSLTGVAAEYELVLLDCPPNLGELTRNALYASTRALVVTEPSFFAVQGAAQAVEAVAVARNSGRPELRLVGILATRVRKRFAEHEFRMAELREAFGASVLPPIPDRTAIQQAQGTCMPVQRWRSTSARQASAAFDALLELVLATSTAPGTEEKL